MSKIYVLHGVNLNLLGAREPDIYGSTTLGEVNQRLETMAQEHDLEVECLQTNYEGQLIDWLTALSPEDFVIINPGAWTHSSYAIGDAIRGVKVPAIEVHLSNIQAREDFRSKSLSAAACLGQISGLGTDSYFLAMAYAIEFQKYRLKTGELNEGANQADTPKDE